MLLCSKTLLSASHLSNTHLSASGILMRLLFSKLCYFQPDLCSKALLLQISELYWLLWSLTLSRIYTQRNWQVIWKSGSDKNHSTAEIGTDRVRNETTKNESLALTQFATNHSSLNTQTNHHIQSYIHFHLNSSKWFRRNFGPFPLRKRAKFTSPPNRFQRRVPQTIQFKHRYFIIGFSIRHTNQPKGKVKFTYFLHSNTQTEHYYRTPKPT